MTMPMCQAWNCTTEQKSGLVFGVVPNPNKDPGNKELYNRAAAWLHNIGTGYTVETLDWGKTGRAKVVCEEHFTEDCFYEDTHIKQCKLLGLTPHYTKRLKIDAIPTIFKHKPDKTDPERAKRAEARVQAKV